ncbi:bacillithiol system redox-active protein YtxJ [Confluentibacter citreus]|uniref:bacillithiol system redox-active protein YtxJ n=1 Tax=Confluentibacter citreus TaxID=2007307 RepID=UPI00293736E2|nr:bacillithiol system redox-active protein YtxJ [Confluentibacter citreus]
MFKIQIMGLFSKLFSSSVEQKEEKSLPWLDLNTINQLQTIKDKSTAKTQVIFKHSTRCGISRMVIKQFTEDFVFSENQLDLYYLDLIAYREVSNAVANTFNVVHESPQLLVIKNSIVVKHESHGGINDLDLNRFI